MKIFILTNSSFPIGMAATRRMLLLAKSITSSQLHSVHVLATRVPPKHLSFEKIPPKGVIDNITFEYTTKTTHRARGFFTRRLIELFGAINALFIISKKKVYGEIDCIYLWETVQRITLFRFIIIMWCLLFKVPLVQELNERTWKDKSNNNLIEKKISPLFGVKGVICISNYLTKWAEQESMKLGKKINIIKIPIVVDIEEGENLTKINMLGNYFLFSGAPEYCDTILFIIDAMRKLWDTHSDSKLKITGFDINDKRAKWLQGNLKKDMTLNKKIEFLGYLPRQELLEEYKGANALLIPLFDNVISTARFPTKIGEYLASGRPIITCNVGEISEYFKDNVNALVTSQASPEEFSEKLCYVINNPTDAARIGEQGKILAKEVFEYRVYSELIIDFFKSVCKTL